MRRALIGLGILVVIVAAGIAVWFLAGGPAAYFRSRVTPVTPFPETSAPPAPDYADPASWAALPQREDEADVVPAGVEAVDQMDLPADVFFIHPTSFFSNQWWNQPIDDEKTNLRTGTLIMRNQASVFNGCCRVYAPRYRQATLGAFYQEGEGYTGPLELAYGDVKRAFAYYVEHWNEGRPFIVASHSQGSAYAPWLLKDVVDGTPLRGLLVAAYIVGFAMPEQWVESQLETIGICRTPEETGCIISWSALGEGLLEGADVGQNPYGGFLYRFGDCWERVGSRFPSCTNPLTWTIGETRVDPTGNPGGWMMRMDAPPDAVPEPVPYLTGARCAHGFLLIDPEPEDFVERSGMPAANHNFHNFDYQLFYMSIRENATARVAAFLRDAAAPPGGE